MWIFALMLCLIDNSICQAQVGFQVSPAKLYFDYKASEEQTLQLHLSNPMNTPLVLQATCADWRRDSTGEKAYYPPGALPASCCSLIKVTPSVIALAPGEQRDVLVTLVPNQRAKSDEVLNGMLFLTQSNEQEVGRLNRTSQFIVKTQIGVHIYVLPRENAQPDMTIIAMDMVRSGEQYQVKVKVHNNGGTLQESQLRLEYLNLETMEEVKAEPISVNTMPKEAFRITANVPPSLSAGKYLVVAVLDSGPSQALKVAELEAVLK